MNVLLTGPNNSGKSAFIYRMYTGQFYEEKKESKIHKLSFNTTNGVYKMNVIDGNIDDLSNIQGIIYMFDSTSENIEGLDEKFKGIPLVVCANKIDKCRKLLSNKFINKFPDVDKYEVSSKTNYNYDKPFVSILRQITKIDELKLK